MYKTARIDGLNIFYREAGPANAPTLVLLHGLPTSSHMFHNLIPALSDKRTRVGCLRAIPSMMSMGEMTK